MERVVKIIYEKWAVFSMEVLLKLNKYNFNSFVAIIVVASCKFNYWKKTKIPIAIVFNLGVDFKVFVNNNMDFLGHAYIFYYEKNVSWYHHFSFWGFFLVFLMQKYEILWLEFLFIVYSSCFIVYCVRL